MSKMVLMAFRGLPVLAAVSLSLSASGPVLAQSMCKHQDYQACIRELCGAPVTPAPPVSGNQPYKPNEAQNQQEACYKVNAEPCRAKNNCPH